jgi:hypothetical protein
MTRENWLKLWGFEDGTPEADAAWANKLSSRRREAGFSVMPDIGEYKSVVDGTFVTSRSQHREHIRRHDLVEVGNERITRREEALPRIGHDIKRALEQLKARA